MWSAVQVKPQTANGVEYVYNDAPAPGTVREVAPGVYWLRMPLPFALDHINLWLLADGAGWTLVDCGFGSDDTRERWRRIFAHHLHGRPVTRVLVTHFHPDHFGLAAWLSEHWCVPVWMSEPEFAAALRWHAGRAPYTRAAHFEMFLKHGLDMAVGHAWGSDSLFRRGVPGVPGEITPLQDGQTLSVGARRWRVIYGRGHSPAHAALCCDELGVLISGDMVLPRISTNVSVQPHQPDADPLALFLESLTRYAECDARTLVLPSHGLPFCGVHERVRQLEQHHAQRLEALWRACDRPRTGAEVLPVLFKRELDPHQTIFAMGEALSHLNYLWSRNELRREYGDDGIYRFART